MPAELAVDMVSAARVANNPRPTSPPTQPLTRREIEVLGMLAEGLANKNIAARLGISEHTVKTHVASILTKLDAFSRLDTFTRAIESRLSPHANVDAVIAHERAISASLGGRTVMDDVRERRAAAPPRKGQLSLFADVR